MSKAFKLQDPGEGIREAKVLDILVSEGDQVSEGDHVLDVETDKSAVEVRADFSGTIEEIKAEKDSVAKVGDVLITYEPQSSDSSSSGKDESKTGKEEVGEKEAPPSQDEKSQNQVAIESSKNQSTTSAEGPTPAAPSTRRLAREQGVDINAIAQGSGPAGRVLDEDVMAAAGKGRDTEAEKTPRKPPSARQGQEDQQESSETPQKDKPQGTRQARTAATSVTTGVRVQRREKLDGVRRATAHRMIQSWSTIPHVMHHDEVAIDDLENMRREHAASIDNPDEKPTLTSYLVKALAAALRQHPHFNARYEESSEEIVYLESRHVGVAVATERGLLVPVVRDADRLSLREMSRELRRVAKQASDGRLTSEEMKGASMTLTNVGAIGGRSFTPIINPPEAAILGVGASYTAFRPAEDDGSPLAVTLLPLSFCFDHRLNDGAQAASFVNSIKELLGNRTSFSLDV